MPSADYQKTLGWMELQLQADKLKRDQAIQEQQRQERVQADQQGFDNALKIGSQALQQRNDQENRKLQLADLMARVKLQEEGKDRRQDDKQAWEQPKIDAAVEKAMAEAGYKKAQTQEVAPNAENQRNYRTDSIAESRRGHNLGFFGALLGKGMTSNVYGQKDLSAGPGLIDQANKAYNEPLPDHTPTLDVPVLRDPTVAAEMGAPAYLEQRNSATAAPQEAAPGLGLQPAPPEDPEIQRLRPADLVKNAEQLQSSQVKIQQLKKLYEDANALSDSNYGLAGGRGPANTLKDLGADAQGLAQALGFMKGGRTPLQSESDARRFVESEAGKQLAQTIHDFSGASANEGEARRLGKAAGMTEADFNLLKKNEATPFALPKPVFLKILKASIALAEQEAGMRQDTAKNKGIRIGGPSTSDLAQKGRRREPEAQVAPTDKRAQQNALFEELVGKGMDPAKAREKVYQDIP